MKIYNKNFLQLRNYVFITLFLTSINIFSQTIYVSPRGNDNNAGTLSSPLKTLQKALDKVAENNSIHEILLREGIYNITNTVSINGSHSGTENNPLVIKPYEGEKVTFTSSVIIDHKAFRKITHPEELKRLPVNSHGKVFVASTRNKNLFENLTSGNYGSISWDGYTLPVAQWPNKGFGYIQTVTDVGPFDRFLAPGESPPPFSFEEPSGGKFIMENSCALDLDLLSEDLQDSEDIAIEGYFHNDWYYDRNFLARVSSENREMRLLKHTRYGIENKSALPRRFKLLHALSQLDMPGEWYHDKKRKLLFIWPVQKLSADKPIAQINNLNLIQGTNSKYIHFKSINFSGFGAFGAKFNNSEHITFSGCSFSSSKGRGLGFNRGMYIKVESCDFFDVHNAFTISGRSENVKDLIQEHNVGINNHIYNCYVRGYGLASISGVGGSFVNNLIHDVNGGIVFSGNDHNIEHNEIYNAGFSMGDWNSIYFGGNIHFFGNKIQHNFFHHFPETPGAHPVTGVRGDDGCSGLSMIGNIFYKTGRGGASGSGPDIHVDQNVGIKINSVWTTTQNPYNKISKEDDLRIKVENHERMQREIAAGTLNVNEKNNYLGRAQLVFGERGWETNQIWIDKYPNFSKIFDITDPESHPWQQSYSTFTKNYVSEGRLPYVSSHGHNPNGTLELVRTYMPNTATLELPEVLNLNTAFENPDELDFRFKDAFKPMDGFEKWDFSKVGLYKDAYRKTIPDKKKYRTEIKARYEGIPSTGGRVNLAQINSRYPDPAYFQVLTSAKNVIPGILEAESYDEGCNGITYFDSDNINVGEKYRKNGVDIEEIDTANGGGFYVTDTKKDEWLEYTVSVEEADIYNLDIKISSKESGSFSIAVDGINVLNNIPVISTRDSWQLISEKIQLGKGQQKIRFHINSGNFKIDKLTFIGKSNIGNDRYQIKTIGETCPNANNGKIAVKGLEEGIYKIEFSDITKTFVNSTSLENIKPGDYDLCIENTNTASISCYKVNIPASNAIIANTKVTANKINVEIDGGTPPYQVLVNGNSVLNSETPFFTVNAKDGDLIEVKTSKECEGIFSKKIHLEGVHIYPQPTKDFVTFDMTGTDLTTVRIDFFTMHSKQIFSSNFNIIDHKVKVNIKDLAPGIYISKIHLKTPIQLKVIKQ